MNADLLKGVDVDKDGLVDSLRTTSSGDLAPGLSGSMQYLYNLTPRWGFGLLAEFGQSRQSSEFGTQKASSGNNVTDFSSNGLELTARHLAVLASVRRAFRPDRSANPYLLGGLGLNHTKLTSRERHFIGCRLGGFSCPVKLREAGELYSRSSLGMAALLGAGVQFSAGRAFVWGFETRWIYMQMDEGKFGDNSWQSASAGVWAGWKWSAPL